MNSGISIILPTFNEENNILPLIKDIQREVDGLDYEIMVIDDQSTDGTPQIVKNIKDGRIKLYSRTLNHGYASAIYFGIQEALFPTVAIMDSDFNHRPSDLAKMIRAMDSYDVVSASRFIAGGKMIPPWRSFCSRTFNLFIKLSTGSSMSDHLFGLFLFRKSLLQNVPVDKIFYGFGDYGIRLLYYLQKSHVRILEVPAVYGLRRTGFGNQRLVKTFIQYVRATLRLSVREGRLS